MATGLLGIAELPRSDIEQLLTRAKDFQRSNHFIGS